MNTTYITYIQMAKRKQKVETN